MEIYQQIWDADQASNGIKPVLNEQMGNDQHGYVVVNEQPTVDQKLNLFSKLVIPQEKQQSYELCTALFDNYSLGQKDVEILTPEETKEMHDFLEFIVDTPPMRIARDYLSTQTGEPYSASRWYQILIDIWFTQFTQSSGRDLSAFEHVVVGEQSASKVSGYHFWYKYYLDDSYHLLNSDDILYLGLKGSNQAENQQVPEVSTISFKWDAFDYKHKKYRPLYKKIGGFFNGCSIEGLMALGTVRFLGAGRAPKEGTINGALYNFKMFRSQNRKHLRTFYPEFVRVIGAPPIEPPTIIITTPGASSAADKGKIRIIAALVNPEGHDPGFETITLLNTSPIPISIDRWRLQDKNNNTLLLENQIPAGQTLQIKLPSNTIQLSNKGGTIKLLDQDAQPIDSVSYTIEQARQQGWTIAF